MTLSEVTVDAAPWANILDSTSIKVYVGVANKLVDKIFHIIFVIVMVKP